MSSRGSSPSSRLKVAPNCHAGVGTDVGVNHRVSSGRRGPATARQVTSGLKLNLSSVAMGVTQLAKDPRCSPRPRSFAPGGRVRPCSAAGDLRHLIVLPLVVVLLCLDTHRTIAPVDTPITPPQTTSGDDGTIGASAHRPDRLTRMHARQGLKRNEIQFLGKMRFCIYFA